MSLNNLYTNLYLQQSENAKVEQHRLKCSVVEPLHTSLSSTANIQMFELPEDLVDRIEQLKNTVRHTSLFNKECLVDFPISDMFFVINNN